MANAAIGMTAQVKSQFASGDSTFMRLHITPLDPDLLGILLPASVLSKARNISYHNIATFPERRYGFVDLPFEDAERLRKKLHGATFKGVKMRVEVARPSDIPLFSGQESAMEAAVEAQQEKDEDRRKLRGNDRFKKRKRDGLELEGIKLEEGRKVKRGWTVPDEGKAGNDKGGRKEKDGEKKKRKSKRETKSKYTDHEECLIKTILPVNVAASTSMVDSGASKKGKRGKLCEVVVHEFEKTTRFPSFLKNSASSRESRQAATEFVDGRGWVDEYGNVLEPVQTKPGRMLQITKPVENQDGESCNNDACPDGQAPEPNRDRAVKRALPETAEETPDSGREEYRTSQSNEKHPPVAQADMASSTDESPLIKKAVSAAAGRKPSASALSLTIKIPPVTSVATEVHPLEALYKRPQKTDGTQVQEHGPAAAFNFFSDEGDSHDEDMRQDHDRSVTAAGGQAPMTPFARQDWESRGIRSAAPTPDTAHPSRRFKPWTNDETEDIREEAEGEEQQETENNELDRGYFCQKGETPDTKGPKHRSLGDETSGQDAANDFRNWFWEHRGNLNRSWKKRRKTATKEKRYRENRSRAERAI